MAKTKYRYNPRTLEYEKLRLNAKAWTLKIVTYLSTSLVFSIIFVIIFFYLFGSPKEKMLEREVKQYELQYQHLNKKLAQIESVLEDMADRDDNIYRIIFEAEPIPSEVRKAGYGGVNRYARLEGYENEDIIMESNRKLDEITSQVYIQSISFDEVYEMARNKAKMLTCIPAIQPVSNKDLRRLSSFFGYRLDPFYKVRKFHKGVDFSAPTGTEIYATGDGVITEAKKSRRNYGNTLLIDHDYGYETLYAHIHEFKVKKGEWVKRGQVIATVGNTGKSTAPHLHYEIHKNGKAVNPIHYFFNDLTPAQYDEVLLLSQRPSQTMD